ncbi:purine-binding chemotaxis protein CheW [Salinibacillus kushneri]|uniref:Purine-binding chemotaxis protein CheW n=1 Tax=Salinibacillus kushneri TaxID=237682 RepID=A0A1I0EQ77_9BACI|nr:chemotaxis protein CheW [Salinibacillus kushneri]SET47445.1 purine-binding chemotaxis protein CheW [Salinibacillus kushneri]
MNKPSKVIVFQLNEEQYGVDITQVISIEKLTEITKVPKTSDFIKGIINIRGEITPIIDLKDRLQIGRSEYTDDTRVLIVQMNDVQVGLIVDSASDVIDIDEGSIDPPPKVIGGVSETFIIGVAKLKERLLILLDMEHVLDLDEVNEIKSVTNES